LDRDITDPSEAAKLVHDVDIQIGIKTTAFMVFQNRLRLLTDMSQTLEECGPMMAELRGMEMAKVGGIPLTLRQMDSWGNFRLSRAGFE
jgi:hypothetical protein